MFFLFAYCSYGEFVGMFYSFYYQFNNRIINITWNRIVGDILRDITAAYSVWEKVSKTWAVSSLFETFIFF